jgi:hypothetical protein
MKVEQVQKGEDTEHEKLIRLNTINKSKL